MYPEHHLQRKNLQLTSTKPTCAFPIQRLLVKRENLRNVERGHAAPMEHVTPDMIQLVQKVNEKPET